MPVATAAAGVCTPDRPSASGVARAYGVPVAGGGSGSTESLRARVVRGRPNWWVILAVSLALMALLVATAGGTSHPGRRAHALGGTASSDSRPAAGVHHDTGATHPGSTTTTTVAASSSAPTGGVGAGPTSEATTSTAAGSRGLGDAGSPGTSSTVATTTTTAPPATTTTTYPGRGPTGRPLRD